MTRSVLLSALAAFVAALAAWIITVNIYTTVRAFQHVDAAPARAFHWGFGIAGVAAIAAFAMVLYARGRRQGANRP